MNDTETQFAKLVPIALQGPDRRSKALSLYAIVGYDSGEAYTPEEYSRAADLLREYHEATGARITEALEFLKAREAT